MTSLSEVYDQVGRVQSLRRLYVGTGVFGAGSLMVIVAIVVATTDILTGFGLSVLEAREIAGVLAGIGVPAVFVGIFIVLPADRRVRAAAAIGSSVAVFAVALFWHAYPEHWAGYGQDLTLPVTAVYFLGTMTTFWCLFTAVANFKARNDPGGTVSLEITREGTTRIVEVDRSELASGLSSIGTFGDPPEGNVTTQTNRPDSTAASDGGSSARTITSPLDDPPSAADDGEVLTENEDADTPVEDQYCGNCSHFEYVRTGRGITPYCEYHGEEMDDMDACEQWTPNR